MFTFIKKLFGLPTAQEIKEAQQPMVAPYKIEPPTLVTPVAVAEVIAQVAVQKTKAVAVKKPRKSRVSSPVKEKASVKTKAPKAVVDKPVVKAPRKSKKV